MGKCRKKREGGLHFLADVNVVSPVGAGSARPSPPVVILLSQRAGKPRPYKACHLGSHFSSFGILGHYFLNIILSGMY